MCDVLLARSFFFAAIWGARIIRSPAKVGESPADRFGPHAGQLCDRHSGCYDDAIHTYIQWMYEQALGIRHPGRSDPLGASRWRLVLIAAAIRFDLLSIEVRPSRAIPRRSRARARAHVHVHDIGHA
ncbi:hypothetical protein C8Q74DRAFT_507068 [Fomes fomentarius]|nr:hypothetical protein C8Q74DRAFT_507068 [Fomes fomentarius]